jgi:hypothetical protein
VTPVPRDTATPPAPGTPQGSASRLGVGAALGVFAVLAVLRILAADLRYFYEEDDMSLANGIASILQGRPGALYRYVPQIGYYHLMAGLSSLFGGIAAVPFVMAISSAVAGAAIPAATLVAFRRELPDHVRLLAAALVTCTPVLWVSAQYGNTAIVAAAVVVPGLVTLANRPGAAGIAWGLALCAAGVLIRADAVLMAPVVVFLVFRAAPSPRKAVTTLLGGAAAFVAVWLGILALDPWGSSSVAGDVGTHFQDVELVSRFWEHLLWAFSPIPLIFALFGADALQRRARSVFLALAAWAGPVLAFYFGAATTPRYFMLAVVPLGILAAVGIDALVGRSPRPRRAWSLALVAAFLHLIVGLGHFRPADWTSVLRGPGYASDDGHMPTGALIYQGYHRGDGVLGMSVRRGPWGSIMPIATEIDRQLERIVATPATEPPPRILVLLDSWNAHVFQYHALRAGARLKRRDPGLLFMAPTHFTLADRTMVSAGIPDDGFTSLERVALEPDDEIWYVAPVLSRLPDIVSARMPEGLTVRGPVDGAGTQVRVYAVARAGSR